MAAREAAQREPRPVSRAVNAQRVRGVMRAGRIKLAGATEYRREENLVDAQQTEQRSLRESGEGATRTRTAVEFYVSSACGGRAPRGSNFSSSSASAEIFAVATELRGCMTMSHPGSIP